MIISVINITNGAVADKDLQRALRAVNRQIAEDFAPYWGFGSQLRLEGRAGGGKDRVNLPDMRGDAVLYLQDVLKVAEVEGYHARHFSGVPYSFVFLELSRKLNEDWTVTLSHEALELTGDAEDNLLVQGPDPRNPKDTVFHWFEMCDAVQNESYLIDGVGVSNFVLPLFFTSSEERGGRNDFLGTVTEGQTLRSFSANPGGYIGFFDPKINGHEQWSPPEDAVAKARRKIKKDAGSGRGQRRMHLLTHKAVG